MYVCMYKYMHIYYPVSYKYIHTYMTPDRRDEFLGVVGRRDDDALGRAALHAVNGIEQSIQRDAPRLLTVIGSAYAYGRIDVVNVLEQDDPGRPVEALEQTLVVHITAVQVDDVNVQAVPCGQVAHQMRLARTRRACLGFRV